MKTKFIEFGTDNERTVDELISLSKGDVVEFDINELYQVINVICKINEKLMVYIVEYL